jgi:hypothetical protein
MIDFHGRKRVLLNRSFAGRPEMIAAALDAGRAAHVEPFLVPSFEAPGLLFSSVHHLGETSLRMIL